MRSRADVPSDVPFEVDVPSEVPFDVPFDEFVARRLIERSRDLSTRWLDVLAARLDDPPRLVFPTRTLLDHAPVLVRHIAEALVSDDDPADGLRPPLTILAHLRREQGYALEEILAEFEALRSIVLDAFLEEAERYPGPIAPLAALRTERRLHEAIFHLSVLTAEAFRSGVDEIRRERAELLATFGRAVRHELRNHVHVALLDVHALRELLGGMPHEARHLLDRLEANLGRLAGIADEVRTIVAAERHQAGLEGRRQSLSELVHEVGRVLERAAKERGVDLRLPDDAPDVQVDASRLHLVLVNLLGNAIKYADPCREEACVELRVRGPKDGLWTVEVLDNGRGMSPALQARAFEESVRGEHDDVEGEGVGLALAREAVQQLGGRIWVTSEPGRGSTFGFTFREPRTDLEREGEASERIAAAPAAAAAERDAARACEEPPPA